MRKLSSVFLITLALTAVMVLAFSVPDVLYSQGGGPAPILPNDPEQTPIDGGLGILAALGGGYAIKKLRDKKE